MRKIARALNVDRGTIARYLRAAQVPVRAPGKWGNGLPQELQDIPNAAKRVATPQASLCEPHRDFIQAKVEAGVDATVIWRDLQRDHGFEGAYGSVKRFVRKLRKRPPPSTFAVIETAPGEEAQVDYGEGPLIWDAASGKYKRSRLFVLVLSHSRKMVPLVVMKSSAQTWAQLVERAFRRLGGAPQVLVLDNLKEGISKVSFTDPEVNDALKAVLKHYGVVAVPCRVRDPNRKGKVERCVDFAQEATRDKTFDSVEDAQEYYDEWDAEVATPRVHGSTKRVVAEAFAEEKPFLRPLPTMPCRLFHHGRRRVDRHGRVEVNVAFYDVPAHLVGAWVKVQWDEREVRILDDTTGELLASRSKKPRRGSESSRTKTKKPSLTQEPCEKAAKAGEHIGHVARRIAVDASAPEMAARRIRALLRLAREHGQGHVDNACSIALQSGAPNLHFVRVYLEKHPPVPLSLKQVDPLIRELNEYRAVVERLTQHDDNTNTQETP